MNHRLAVRVGWMKPAEMIEPWCAVLDDAERARAARFHCAADRAAFIAAHLLTRQMLSEAAGMPSREIVFARAAGGRPYAVNAAPWHFSLSHTRRLVACAVTEAGAVGLDVEPLSRAVEAEAIAQRFFAPAEAQLVATGGRMVFLRLWTLKEAYLKATGAGLAGGLHTCCFTLDPIRLQGNDGWRFAQCWPVAGHLVAVALHAPGAAALAVELIEYRLSGHGAERALDALAMRPLESVLDRHRHICSERLPDGEGAASAHTQALSITEYGFHGPPSSAQATPEQIGTPVVITSPLSWLIVAVVAGIALAVAL